ncbi:MAG: hypothetical protein AAGE52_15245 [Myxococcota bacterium]
MDVPTSLGELVATSQYRQYLRPLRDGERFDTALVSTDSSVIWQVGREDADVVGGIGNLSFEHDGRVYLTNGRWMFALQTDVLPPDRGTCVNWNCNARHNNWLDSP